MLDACSRFIGVEYLLATPTLLRARGNGVYRSSMFGACRDDVFWGETKENFSA
jgi:hypothetical protein